MSACPTRAPASRPPAKPNRVAPPTTKPWKNPAAAVASVSATMIQSRTVTGGRAGYPPGELEHAGAVTWGATALAASPAPATCAARPRTPPGPLAARERPAGPVRRGLRRRRRRRRAPHLGRRGPRAALRRGVGARGLRHDVLAADRGRARARVPPALRDRLPGRAAHRHRDEGRHRQAAQGRRRLPR